MKKFSSFSFSQLFALLLLSLTGVSIPALAQDVSPNQAKTVARNFFYQQNKTLSSRNQSRISNFQPIVFEGKTVMYIAQMNEKGFVIVNNAQEVTPVLAYGFTGGENLELNPEANNYLLSYKKQIADLKNHVYEIDVDTKNKSTEIWGLLSNEKFERSDIAAKMIGGGDPMNTQAVGPLLTSTWGQGMPYGTYCPDSAGYKCAVGCVAVAMAQIMNFHQHPSIGVGSHNYNCDYGNESANFGTTNYHITTLPDNLSGANASNTNVPRLLYHCGVSVDMDYQPSGSGAYVTNWFYTDAEDAFEDYFGYSSNGTTSSGNGYVAYIQGEINAGRPQLMRGDGSKGGHAWVCDGYSGSNLHMNWGWNGSADGYFMVGALSPNGVDLNSGNEVLSVQPVLSDLSPIASVSPSSVNQGSSVTVSTVVQNVGGFRCAPTTLKYYASTNSTFDNSDTYLGSSSVPIIESLFPASVSKTVTIGNAYTGNVYVIVIADANGDVRESNESNNKFAAPVTINYCTLSMSNLNIYGNLYSTPVTVSSNTNWTATSNVGWISVNSGSGSNNGTFFLNIPSNPNNSSRSGIVTVNANGMTRIITVTQGAAVNITVSPATLTTHYAAHSDNINLTTTVPATVTSNAAWLSGSPSNLAAGATSLTYTVQANTNTTSRVGILTISGYGQTKTVTVTQLGKNDEPCNAITLPVCPSNLCAINYYSNAGSTVTASIPTTGCTLLNNDVWFKFTVPPSGNFTITTNVGQNSPVMTDGVIGVYVATSCSTTTLIACNDDYNGNLMPKVAKTGYAGSTIYVRVSGYTNAYAGEFGISVTNTYSPVQAPNPGGDLGMETAKMSKEVTIETLDFAVFPNPANEQLNFRLTTPETETLHCTLIDMNGRIVWEQAYEVEAGNNELSFNTQSLVDGMYILQVNGKSVKENTKVMIVH